MSTDQQSSAPPAELVGGTYGTSAASSTTAEQSFQVVGAKKSSQSGGRRGESRDRITHSSSRGHHGHPMSMDDTSNSRKKGQSSHKDRENKPRPSNQRSHVGHKESSKVGGASHTASRGKTGDSNHAHHFTNSHRNGSDSNSSQSKSNSKQMASIKRVERVDTEQLECDTSYVSLSSSSGENQSSSSLSVSTSSSVSGSSTVPSSKGSEEKKVGRDRNFRSGRGNPRNKNSFKTQEYIDAGTGLSSNSETRREQKDAIGSQKKKSPKLIKFDLPPEKEALAGTELSSTDKSVPKKTDNVKNSPDPPSSKIDGSHCGSGSGDVDGDVATHSTEVQTRKSKRIVDADARIVYTRKELLALNVSSHTVPSPAIHDLELCRRRSSSAPPSPDCVDSTLHKEFSDSIEAAKHPTALTLIREHADKMVGKVSLSPQRRSFQRGCSWKDRLNQQNESLQSKPDGQKSSHTQGMPRVIHHVPYHDQEQVNSGEKGWRQEAERKDNRYVGREPEPEWMEFGPTDRFDVIELKGFDDHEIEREARKDTDFAVDESENADKYNLPTENKREQVSKENRNHSLGGDEENPLRYPDEKNSMVVDGGEKPKPDHKEEENEFILDGFDFSTGVSICQELDLDEEEEKEETMAASGLLSHKEVKSPTQLSNVLMKALGVAKGKEPGHSQTNKTTATSLATSSSTGSEVIMAGVAPANALTLDEIHAQENIQSTPSQAPLGTTSSEGEGMKAFNKLLAAMQSKQDKSNQKPVQEEHLPFPSSQYYPPPSLAPTNNTNSSNPHMTRYTRADSGGGMKRVLPGYGSSYLIEKDLLDLDEDLTASNLPFPSDLSDGLVSRGEPNLVRLERLERMLEKMDQMDPMGPQLQSYPSMPHPPHSFIPPGPHHAHSHPHARHQMDPHVPMHPSQLDRGEGRGWMYHEGQQHGMRQMVDRTHPSPQQMEAVRQHQMLTSGNTRSANNWAVEMERRRVTELRQMQLAKERELYGTSPHANKVSSSKPNIGLLPTAVMRHMHTKHSQPAADIPKTKTTSMSNKPDQDLTSKASQTHSALMGGHDLPLPPSGPSDFPPFQPPPHVAGMRMRPLPPGHTPPKVRDMASAGMMYPHYSVPMSHGMPVRNPYMY